MEDKMLRVEMPDGSKWDIPVMAIARDRAECYKDEFNWDVKESLEEGTLPLFKSDDYEIHYWAANSMYWHDMVKIAKKVTKEQGVDFDKSWVDGNYEIVTI